jgi:hypothetical protein
MPTVTESPYTQEQVKVWLRGLLTLAWADGDFTDDEKALITTITEDELAPCLDFEHFEPVTPDEVAQVLGTDPPMAENFLRMAVMVALSDGVNSRLCARRSTSKTPCWLRCDRPSTALGLNLGLNLAWPQGYIPRRTAAKSTPSNPPVSGSISWRCTIPAWLVLCAS